MNCTRVLKAIGRRGYATKSADFIKSHDAYNVTTYARPELVLTRGKGSQLWDMEGKEYVDFTAGIAVTALGHSHDEITKIMTEQAGTLIHSSNLYHNDHTGRLAKKIVTATRESGGMSDASRVFLANSGSEANEAALKFARKYGKAQSEDKIEIVSFAKSFHGRTFGSLTATVNDKYQAPFRPMVPGFRHGEINDVAALETLVTDKTCAVIVEPIQGEGGVNALSKEFAEALRKRTKEVGALLIFDEIQCGLGRTGTLWAHQHFGPGAQPDILTMAKALGNGYPIGATMVTEEVEKVLKVGDHGTTYGGNPLGARIGHYVVSQLSSPELLGAVEAKSQIFQDRFQQWQSKFGSTVGEHRGRGLLLGLQLKKDPAPVLARAQQDGLLVITCGVNTLRFVPALNIPDELITKGLDILEGALASVE